ncbi:M28 family metallopeptidase [Solimonas terrae]|uniref:M28 family peptidase n=1 Tax=Solimonas terrae TaxID=1396819 RepID=A0A6M2BQE4_9GAMM|nr:M28 family metallopeptidase [Solimonas terrae]NGY04425.1 M28 family peptidase [Solimonas terrae]
MTKTHLRNGFCAATLAVSAACTAPAPSPTPAAAAADPLAPAEAAITPDLILGHIKVLASDEFEGRLPGTPGEDKSVAYISQQFEALHLAPGNPDGSYVQRVPLVGITGSATMKMVAGGKTIKLSAGHDFVATTAHVVPEVKVKNAPMVFVGYGVQAPEYAWDDYKGLDVKGKTIVMLINDPAVPDPNDPSRLDPAMFKGDAMTYYGRWTYKYEIASRLGAAAAIIVHETRPAAYPWAVVENSWSGEQFSLAAADRNLGTVPVKAWITLDKAHELFKDAGLDFDALKKAALSRDFKPVPLKAKASFTIDNKLREVQSHNVIAKLEGSDPALKDQYLIYSAHWDHLGRDRSLPGDQIFNGAADNASGVAGLLAIAKAYTTLPAPPKRSVLFMSVTAEEQGLLGSRYYATHPLYPLTRTLADFNMDVLNTYGATRDTQIIGAGQNSIEDLYARAAARHDRVVVPDNEADKGFYYRSDQFEFAKEGLPSLYIKRGIDVIGKPAGYGQSQLDDYTANRYHKPADEVSADWDLSGAVADTQLLFETGDVIANGDTWPTWKDGSEFKAIREQSLAH